MKIDKIKLEKIKLEKLKNAFYTLREERINYISHALGVIIAIIAGFFLIRKALIETAQAQDCIAVIWWLAAGGVFYIIGAFIYAKAKKEFTHAIFHIFVLFGLISHIISAYLIPL